MTEDLVIIFTRNPELGKVKTRLAASIGDAAALDIYRILVQHTMEVTKNLTADTQVHYSEKIHVNDLWNPTIFDKKLQQGADLGARMEHAFASGFKAGYRRIVIVGCDIYELEQTDLEHALTALQTHDFVVGPAKDGGYYLLGMKQLRSSLFRHKKWGTETVLSDTLQDLENDTVYLLPIKNDIDLLEDLKDQNVFEQFLTNKTDSST